MLAKILQKTKGKKCSCPTGKQCTSCKLKKVIPPRVIVEEPRRLPAPVSITYYNPPKPVYQNSTNIHYVDKPKRKKIWKKKKYDSSPPRCMNFCRWYKRRKVLRELKKEKEEEDKKERKRKHEEYERERMKELIQWEQTKLKSHPVPTSQPKRVYFKERSASVGPKPKPKPKPRVYSKYVTVKKLDGKNSISNRFVNYCYRFCCQLYCYLTCIILVIIAVLYIA